MSFASNVRAEIARELCVEACCARAELAAALLAPGGISYRLGAANPYALSITSAEAASVRHYFQLLKRHFNVIAQIRTLQSSSLGGVTRYQLIIPDENALELMRASGIYDPEAPFGKAAAPKPEIFRYDCCRKAFVKSAFMISGAISSPQIEYHAEIDAPDEAYAECVTMCLSTFEIRSKQLPRKSRCIVYLKRGEDVADLLTLMGAPQSALEIHDVRVKKSVSNRVNRLMNCDNANTDRTAETAARQIEDIQYIEAEIGLEKLPPLLREMAELRLQNNSASLAALGELLQKPIGKSGVNARLHRLSEIANRLRGGEEIQF